MPRNLNLLTIQLAALAVAFATLGYEEEAATLIGGITGPHLTFGTMYRNTINLTSTSQRVRLGLGNERFQAAADRSARWSYDELVDWALGVLDRIADAADAT